jgi:hypothetical protein
MLVARQCLASIAAILLVGPCSSATAPDSKTTGDAPRTLEDLRKTIASINNSGDRAADPAALEREQALKRLKIYRYLARVPHDNLVLDDDLCKTARAGARLCERLGRLDHRPENPGLSADDYQLGLKGTSSSNLAEGFPTLAKSIDAWMDDSNPSNLDKLGHRRWCLFPYLQKVGLGRSGKFSAMYILDHSQQDVSDFDFVAFPAPGPMPVEYFGPQWAWNVSLNPQKFRPPSAEVKPSIQEIDKTDKRIGAPLTLNHHSVSSDGFGLPGCIIFRPSAIALRPGKRYQVLIEGLLTSRGEKAKPVTYTVEFVSVR